VNASRVFLRIGRVTLVRTLDNQVGVDLIAVKGASWFVEHVLVEVPLLGLLLAILYSLLVAA
jgi:hypothetical protein